MLKNHFKILVCGDCAVTVSFGDSISVAVNKMVTAFSNYLQKNPIYGVTDLIPTYSALTICYNPVIINYNKICTEIKNSIKKIETTSDTLKKIIVIPVCYNDDFGEDLKDVANHAGITTENVIRIHTSVDYLIYMMGFLPGFAYLGDLDKRIATPRLETPRKIISAGSVGIGGEQTGIYPLSSPGGWRLIGKTPVKPYDSRRENAFLYQAGDYIRFQSVSRKEYDEIKELVSANQYSCRVLEAKL